MTPESWVTAVQELEQAVATVAAPHAASAADDAAADTVAVDLADMLRVVDDDDLTHLVRRLQNMASRLAAAAAVAAGEWDRRRLWRSDGHRAAGTALSTIAGLSPESARRELRRGRALRNMPGTSRAVLEGRVTVDHVDLLGKADASWRHAVFAEHEPMLVDLCGEHRFVKARWLVQYWMQRADDTATAAEARLRSDDVYCWASHTLDDQVAVNARLDPIGGEIFRDELHRLQRHEYLKDLRSNGSRTPAQLRAAALVEMAHRSAALGGNTRRARPVFVVHVGDDSMRHMCQLASGVVLHPSELVPYVDDALMETILFDSPHTVVGVSPQRSFTGVLRRAIMARDKFCTHPSGCDEPAHRCDVDHIIPWSRGGPTHQENGRLRCTTHNRDPQLWPDDMFTSGAPPANSSPPTHQHDESGTPVEGHFVAADLPPTYRHITADDIASVRRRWRIRHGLGALEEGLFDAA